MDKKTNNKTSNFFKKEGFYVVLFVCLCVVATVAAITARNNRQLASNPPATANEQAKVDTQKPILAEEPSKPHDNALQVKKEGSKEKEQNVAKASKAASDAVAPVAKPVSLTFEKPITKGSVVRNFSEEPVFWDSTDSSRPNFGIDVKAEIGEAVTACADGVVKKIGFDNSGQFVEIDHQNGIVTKYCNLDEKVAVKQGDKIKQKQEIGKVGNTTLNAAHEKYGSHLHLEVFKNGNQVDPTKYIKY